MSIANRHSETQWMPKMTPTPVSSFDANYTVCLHCVAQVERQRTLEQKLRRMVKRKAAQGDYSSAIAYLNQIINRHPNSAIDFNNRGLFHFYQGQCLKAMHDYQMAIALNPQLDSAYNNRGNCHIAQGNVYLGIKDYETVIDLNPANLKGWINLGVTLRELGCYDIALEKFDFALILSNAKYEGRIYAERGYTYHLRGDWNCAIADYRRALTLIPLHLPYREKVHQWLSELLSPEEGLGDGV